jgi:hypothetical protein
MSNVNKRDETRLTSTIDEWLHLGYDMTKSLDMLRTIVSRRIIVMFQMRTNTHHVLLVSYNDNNKWYRIRFKTNLISKTTNEHKHNFVRSCCYVESKIQHKQSWAELFVLSIDYLEKLHTNLINGILCLGHYSTINSSEDTWTWIEFNSNVFHQRTCRTIIEWIHMWRF